MFVDRVKLDLFAGKGGNGVVAWRREKFIPKGGPAGGNGGKGGSVTIIADAQVYSLEWYRNRRILKAENGMPGANNNRQGRNGVDLVLKVPCGTLVKDMNTGEVLHDFTEDKQKWVICKGGKGGKGNDCFKTPTNRAPNICTEGTAADLIKLAMLKIDAELTRLSMKSYMILQIHDELIFEAPDNELEALTHLVKDAMQSVFKLKVPLTVDITIGKNWKEC